MCFTKINRNMFAILLDQYAMQTFHKLVLKVADLEFEIFLGVRFILEGTFFHKVIFKFSMDLASKIN